MKVAVVGVTGMVGRVMLKVLEERNFPVSELLAVASEKSVGKKIDFQSKEVEVISMASAIAQKPQLAIFSAGGAIAKEFAPQFAAVGTTVIDNSSAFRMDEDKPLIVPEVNIGSLKPSDKIIANPNCSTIQLVVALHPIHQKYGLKRLVISTYQSMTGTGVQAVKQYEEEMQTGKAMNPAYPHPIFQNCLPHCDVFFENGYTREELKLVHETRKIFDNNDLQITATAVRVPVQGGHSESVNLSLMKDFDITELKSILEVADGIVVVDDPSKNEYPMPLSAHHKDEVFVGRIRRDDSAENSLNMWIVADNLRKGAATNAVQIAAYLVKKGWLKTTKGIH